MHDIDMSNLSAMEQKYFKILRANAGVLYITGKPGIGKSAIAESLAKKIGYKYIDIRLSSADETDMGLYPYPMKTDDGITYLSYLPPAWAVEANQQPTLVHIEELNRCPKSIQNAALQVLNERRVGHFKLNECVLLIASGNLGEDDDCDVEQFDRALNNRLIHIEHRLTIEDWINGYALEKVHPIIVKYLNSRETAFYQTKGNNPAFATPRTWTNLSHYIIKNYGKDSKVDDFREDMNFVAPAYVGISAVDFINYLNSLKYITLDNVVKHYLNDNEKGKEIREGIKSEGRAKQSELINELISIDYDKYNQNEINNIVGFLKDCMDDERSFFLRKGVLERMDFYDVLSKENKNIKNSNVYKLINAFSDDFKDITSKYKECSTNSGNV